MANFFKEATDDLDGMKKKLLGPSYSYSEQIKSPKEMGMSGNGNDIVTNIDGIRSYVQVLFAGGGNASKTDGALGKKYFLHTGAKCKDVKTGKQVTRSLYINNLPEKKTPSISSGLGETYTTEVGLMPGILNDLENMNPFGLFGAFMAGTNPDCMAITLPTKNAENQIGTDTKYLTVNDVKNMSPCWFPDNTNPITKKSGDNCVSKSIENNMEQTSGGNCSLKSAWSNDSKMSHEWAKLCGTKPSQESCTKIGWCKWNNVEQTPDGNCGLKSAFSNDSKMSHEWAKLCSTKPAKSSCSKIGFCKWNGSEGFQNQLNNEYESESPFDELNILNDLFDLNDSSIFKFSDIVAYMYFTSLIILFFSLVRGKG